MEHAIPVLAAAIVVAVAGFALSSRCGGRPLGPFRPPRGAASPADRVFDFLTTAGGFLVAARLAVDLFWPAFPGRVDLVAATVSSLALLGIAGALGDRAARYLAAGSRATEP
mgnify:CR=1 FL=1